MIAGGGGGGRAAGEVLVELHGKELSSYSDSDIAIVIGNGGNGGSPDNYGATGGNTTFNGAE